ncbi:MAG: vitamin B12-dependent ribonucleotide reductase [Planctomycetaceae bacterium]|jgi:ribonucleoside-diphosphate reductase alpha chain|nr:vitamin B12-dependent ribonucleotide reductase [Planctomycetaceae bacterium]
MLQEPVKTNISRFTNETERLNSAANHNGAEHAVVHEREIHGANGFGQNGNHGNNGRSHYESTMNDLKELRKQHGLEISNVFCPEDVADPFETVEWTKRSASIKGDNDEPVFEQTDCEFPKSWSQLAINVVASKYFYGENHTNQREKSVRQVIRRVARTIADWGIEDGYFATQEDGERFYRELTWLCLHQCVAFNSPVWFNVGLYQQYKVVGAKCNWHWSETAGEAIQPENPYEFPQASACFIQSVDDNMEAIMELAKSEALLFKFGSGTGTDLSTIRSCRERLSGGGKPSGPLSFMRVYDQIAAVVKSGGKTRRAAKMQSLKVWHPDIMEFIDCKQSEEEKARILVKNGLHWDDAYSSVMYQNANLSVRVTDDFMRAVKEDKDWATRFVTNTTKQGPEYRARDVFDKIANCAWLCGDPGLQYDTIINRWHTCPNSGRINASNPCSEYMFIDDSACNLASVNLMRFRDESGTFDAKRFIAACRIAFIAQDILVDRASYPIKKIAENSHKFRALGLGYSNLGSLIMSMGLPYDSDESRGFCSVVTALLHGAACRTSAELAASVGVFEGYAENTIPMLHVMEMHWDAANKISTSYKTLKSAARELWDEVLELGKTNGFRNAQATVLAPTGTISFMMDCDTTGIEPDIALIKFKQLAGGGTLKIVNQTVPLALKTLGYSQEEIDRIQRFIEENRTIDGAKDLLPEHLPVFDCAFPAPGSGRCISWQAHLKMMAAAQPFLSGAISKTVNMPSSATKKDIADAYMLGWELGLKAVAVYRDGSKTAQPLSTGDGKEDGKEEKSEASKKLKKVAVGPRREHLPDTRQSITHKFHISGHEGYITVGLYHDGRPGELFITMAKEGSTIGGLMDCFSTALSMSLQYGVPLSAYVQKFSHTRFEPMGYTKNPDIPIAKSIVDYIFRWLSKTFFDAKGNAILRTSPDFLTHDVKTPAVSVKEKELDVLTDPVQPSAKTEKTAADHLALEPPKPTEGTSATLSSQYASFQSDAPACDACGAITVRSGNCYLCYNCGKSMGCS